MVLKLQYFRQVVGNSCSGIPPQHSYKWNKYEKKSNNRIHLIDFISIMFNMSLPSSPITLTKNVVIIYR